jgi:hypothetical protein
MNFLNLLSSVLRKTILCGLLLNACILVPDCTYGQLQDDFSDGDFSTNPSWNGTNENFVVSGGELQLSDLDPINAQSYLAVASSLVTLSQQEWKFKVRQTFSGSDSNQSRIYLTSDAAVLQYSGNGSAGVSGYFLKLGEALSADVIRFYKDDGTTTELLASGTSNISTSFDISVKVVRDGSGNWTISLDPAAGDNYSVEATTNDNSYNTSEYFGIVCTYTSSNADNFFFDDIYVGEIQLDTTSPEIINVTATSANSVDVLFSEAVNETQAESVLNYILLPSTNPSIATRDISNAALVHLLFSSEFEVNTDYDLETSAIADLAGNQMLTTTSSFQWVVAAVPGYRSVVFNEILADPTPIVALPDAEFVELYNTSTENSFQLQDWVFVNSTTEKILPEFALGPQSHVILCDAGNAALFESLGNVIGIASFTSLTNTGDSLTLKSADGELIDVVVYSDSWFDTESKKEGGWTLEQINPFLPCQTAGNWRESLNPLGGTPNNTNSIFSSAPDTEAPTVLSVLVLNSNEISIVFSESMDTSGVDVLSWSLIPFNSFSSFFWNATLDALTLSTQLPISPPNTYNIGINNISDCSGVPISETSIEFTIGFAPQPGDIIINEIMADPSPIVGLPDAEFVEIRNNTSTLLDISDIRLNTGVFNSQVLIQPSGFLIVAKTGDESLFSNFSNAAFMTGFPGLTNSGAELELTNADEVLFDQVAYSDEWYEDDIKAEGGWTLERINPEVICSGAYNWTSSSNASGGTPGNENSAYNDTPNGNPAVLAHGALNENQLYLRFSESMDTQSFQNIDPATTNGNTVTTPVWNSDKDLLILSLVNTIVPETEYSLDITGLTDCDGNGATPVELTFLKGIDPTAGDLLINEIMADGSDEGQVANPSADFIEIYNTTEHIVEMTRVRVNDGFFLQQVIILPDSFLIITDNENSPIQFFAYPNTSFMQDFPSLIENGTTITLAIDNEILDRITYNKSYYNDPSKESGGYSMERVNPNDPCNSSENWKACTNSNGTSAGRTNSVFDTTPDVTAPKILYTISAPEESVTIVFNEPIDNNSLEDAIWVVNGELQENINPYITGAESNEVVLYFGEMSSGVIYSFELNGVTDCWGNEASITNGKFALPETPEPGDLIINEVLFNPYEDGEDFIEVYNNSLKTISLKGWKIADATNDIMNAADSISSVDLLFFPGEYFALTQNISQITNFYPEAKADRMLIIPGLADYSSDDKIFLIMPDNNISDELEYDAEMHYPLINDDDGISLERIAFNRPTSDRTNWHSASEFSGYATPGYLNSQSFNSVLNDGLLEVDPEIFSPDNDGYRDVVTFNYKMDGPGYNGMLQIYDSEGRAVRTLMQSELLGLSGSISWDGFRDDKLKASVGIYVIYFEAFNTEGNVVKTKKTCVLAHSLD